MTTGQMTSEATGNDGLRRLGEPRTAASNCVPTSGAPNKPMVPTAPASPTVNPLRPMRRHIGQPLGSSESDERRPASEHESGRERRENQRATTDNGLRAASCERRGAGNVMARRATATATTRVGERPASGTATVAFTPAFSIPNKPMVPTAHACFNEHPIDPVRRHMGRPLGGEQRPTKSNTRATVNVQRGQRRDDGPGDQRDDQRRRIAADNGPASDLLVEQLEDCLQQGFRVWTCQEVEIAWVETVAG